MFRIGFTGTQVGMFQRQRVNLRALLQQRCVDGSQFHHGDCVGADEQAHNIASQIGYEIIIHPPINESKRAFCSCAGVEWSLVVALTPKPYLKRNRDIVDACELLIAAPKGKEELRSGTWSTVRYARKRGKPVIILMPEGEVLRE